MDEVPIIRCIGFNYRDHAREASMSISNVLVLFIKPRTAFNDPDPVKINIPKIAQDGTSDYEAELLVIISKTSRDIPKEKALDYVLGYTMMLELVPSNSRTAGGVSRKVGGPVIQNRP